MGHANGKEKSIFDCYVIKTEDTASRQGGTHLPGATGTAAGIVLAFSSSITCSASGCHTTTAMSTRSSNEGISSRTSTSHA